MRAQQPYHFVMVSKLSIELRPNCILLVQDLWHRLSSLLRNAIPTRFVLRREGLVDVIPVQEVVSTIGHPMDNDLSVSVPYQSGLNSFLRAPDCKRADIREYTEPTSSQRLCVMANYPLTPHVRNESTERAPWKQGPGVRALFVYCL